MCCTLVDVGPINHEDEEEDDKGYTEDDLGGVEEHKTIILHLLSQLKLGMDLTKVRIVTKYPRIDGIWSHFFPLNFYIDRISD